VLANFAGTYAEWSPSGEGIRIFCRAKPMAAGVNVDGVEVYTSGRYLTVTGHVLAEGV
jgi:primase-polymerase (primpol)-like protein